MSNLKWDYKGFLFTSLYSKYRERVLPSAAYLKSLQIESSSENQSQEKDFFQRQKQGTIKESNVSYH